MDAELRAELLRRMEKDQAARRARDTAAWQAADAENLPWLKQVIAEAGWPTASLVGEDGALAAWLLVQHADRDPRFQRQCLGLLTAAAEQGEASPAHVAYLTDRVLLAEGKQQEYGTQAIGRESGWAARNLRDPADVDERRARAGLRPLAEYLAGMLESYGPPRPFTMPCRTCGAMIEYWLPDEGQSASVACGGCGETTTLTLGGPLPKGSGAS